MLTRKSAEVQNTNVCISLYAMEILTDMPPSRFTQTPEVRTIPDIETTLELPKPVQTLTTAHDARLFILDTTLQNLLGVDISLTIDAHIFRVFFLRFPLG